MKSLPERCRPFWVLARTPGANSLTAKEPSGTFSLVRGSAYICNPVADNRVTAGVGWIAQISAIALACLVAIPIFEKPIALVSGHPLSQIIGVFTITQSILVLQPTRLPKQKIDGQKWHALIHVISFLSFVAGITVIEYNKVHNGLEHFHSPHAYIGVIACAVLVLQYLVGITMWAVPALYGGVDNAKSVWKYHRWGGYLVLLLLLASVISATRTDYVRDVLDIQIFGVSAVSTLLVFAIFARMSLKKLGLKR